MAKNGSPSDRSSSSVEAWIQNIEIMDELPEHLDGDCEPPAYSPTEQSQTFVPDTHFCCAYVSYWKNMRFVDWLTGTGSVNLANVFDKIPPLTMRCCKNLPNTFFSAGWHYAARTTEIFFQAKGGLVR